VARLGGDLLPGETIDAIVARTDGVPLFVEELTKAVLETGEASISASLHDSLMARLDRTPEVKEVAQIAASIGREFRFRFARRARRPPGVRRAVIIGDEASADRASAGSRGALPRLTVTRQHLRSAGHGVAERLIETDAADLPSVRPARRCEAPVGDPAERLLAPNHAAD
jgi:hypothetical protein